MDFEDVTPDACGENNDGGHDDNGSDGGFDEGGDEGGDVGGAAATSRSKYGHPTAKKKNRQKPPPNDVVCVETVFRRCVAALLVRVNSVQRRRKRA